jgi:hypothetical protein
MAINYDGKTENGIPYVVRLYETNYRYTVTVDDLDALAPSRKQALSGGAVTSYTIGNRSITRNQLSAADALKQWDKLMNLKLRLEAGVAPRKAVGIVHRDW